MYKLIKHTSIKNLKEKWINLYNQNTTLSPYQSYYINLIIKNCTPFNRQRLFLRYAFFELIDENNSTCMILPLYLKKIKDTIYAYIFGDFCQTGYLDFIYSEHVPLEAFDSALNLIRQSIGKVNFIFNKVNERSLLNKYLSKTINCNLVKSEQSPCVHISLAGSFDDYWNKLSKSTKQNIRTSYNRLNKDSLNYIVDISINKPMSGSTLNEIYKVYWKRASVRKVGKDKSNLPNFIRNRLHPIIVAQKKTNNVFYSVLRINNKVAGFCAGFISIDNRIILPYLAIDDNYAKYSPGGILIIDTIKHLLENHNFTFFDLSRGAEPYKIIYGGTTHYNNSYEFY